MFPVRGSCGRYPMLPLRVTVPASGMVSPARIRIRVVLPAPLRPTSPTRSPSPILIDTPDMSRRAPARTSSSDVAITARVYPPRRVQMAGRTSGCHHVTGGTYPRGTPAHTSGAHSEGARDAVRRRQGRHQQGRRPSRRHHRARRWGHRRDWRRGRGSRRRHPRHAPEGQGRQGIHGSAADRRWLPDLLPDGRWRHHAAGRGRAGEATAAQGHPATWRRAATSRPRSSSTPTACSPRPTTRPTRCGPPSSPVSAGTTQPRD